MMSLRPLLLLLLLVVLPVQAAEPLPVVASFSILGDLVQQVGGEQVRVITLVGSDSDAHLYRPTPADARAVAEARLVVLNGLGFEGWMERLLEASGGQGQRVVASDGITPLLDDHAGHHHGAVDPHAWQDLAHVEIYVANIATALAAVDPAHAEGYQQRATALRARLAALDSELRQRLARIPRERRRVITSHDAFGYLGRAYDITLLAPVGASTEAEPSAADVAQLIRQVRAEKVQALFVENISDRRLLQRIADETGVRIGGVLYSDALSSAEGPAATFEALFRHNMEQLLAAMSPEP